MNKFIKIYNVYLILITAVNTAVLWLLFVLSEKKEGENRKCSLENH